jgi:hypothetical protein
MLMAVRMVVVVRVIMAIVRHRIRPSGFVYASIRNPVAATGSSGICTKE